MKIHRWTVRSLIMTSIGIFLGNSGAFAQALPNDAPPEDQKGITVEARGPVHEAFAQPGYVVPQASVIVPKEPPAPVPEEPPDQKPAGNVQWVPGYWAWDADRSDFLWVSGFWRQPPPNRRWVPGNWNRVDDGWQWSPGYWASDTAEEAPYVQAPPETLDNGPNIPAPDDNNVYVPGIWVYRNSGFVWRPGYWLACQAGWLWNAPHYCWTPRGYLFCDGFWDYPLENRGLLFAPVSFASPLWNNPGWCYRPWCGVGVPSLLTSLFIGPRCNHYWFGDWYGDRYARLGFRSWVGAGARFHDPLLGYYRWSHRDNPAWYRDLRALDAGRHDGTFERPGRTLAEQNALLRNGGGRTNVNNLFASNRNEYLRTVAPAHELGKLSRVSEEQRRTEISRSRDVESLRQHRTEVQHANVGRLNLSTGRPATVDHARGVETRPGTVEHGRGVESRPASVDHGRVEPRAPQHVEPRAPQQMESRAPQHVESRMPQRAMTPQVNPQHNLPPQVNPQHAAMPHVNPMPHAPAAPSHPAAARPPQQRAYQPAAHPAPARAPAAVHPRPQPQQHAAPRPAARPAPHPAPARRR